MSTTRAPRSDKQNQGCLGLIAVVVGIGLLAKCADGSKATNDVAVQSWQASTEATPVATETPILEQTKSNLVIGADAFGKVDAVDDATSSVIYSKNCYAALQDQFTWMKLDQCGAFDAVSAHRASEGLQSGDDTELAYLDGEAAAGRFLAAAKPHVDDLSTMDQRWSSIDDYANQLTKRVVARNSAKAAELEEATQKLGDASDYSYIDESGNLVESAGASASAESEEDGAD